MMTRRQESGQPTLAPFATLEAEAIHRECDRAVQANSPPYEHQQNGDAAEDQPVQGEADRVERLVLYKGMAESPVLFPVERGRAPTPRVLHFHKFPVCEGLDDHGRGDEG